MDRTRRETKYHDGLRDALCRDLANAVPRADACRRAGISPRTLRYWLSWGRKGEEPYAALLAAVRKAESDAVAKHLSNIEAHAVDTWQASAWTLERRWPEKFGSQRGEIRELRKQVQELLTLVHVGHLTSAAAASPAGSPRPRRTSRR
jgi:transposase